MEKSRIQKIIAESGLCSRRKAEELISSGRVTVNGRPCGLGDKASPADIIAVDGKPLAPEGVKRYIMLNKPRGYVTTLSDEKGRKTVAELISDVRERVVPVGRLDRDSEGLLLFSNDGDFVNTITHPSRHVSKTYRVTINGKVTEEQIMKLSSGVELDDGKVTAPCTVEVLVEEPERTVLLFVIHQGLNRQIRRMCAALGLSVGRLRRIAVGGVKLGMLKVGEWRELTPKELSILRSGANSAEKRSHNEK